MASRGNQILITVEAKGRFIEGEIQGALQPGIAMQIDVSEPIVGGRYVWEAYNRDVDAQQGLVCILLEDRHQGKLMTDAYVDGDRCSMYCPLPGDEMNILLQDVGGTADDHPVGEYVIIDDGTGTFLVTTGTAADKSEPFFIMEAVTDPAADTLAWAMATGS